MKTIRQWIGPRPDAVCAAFKKYLFLQPWQIAVRIDFTFERVWCVREGNNLLLKDGSLLPITTVYANGKALTGRDDAYQTGISHTEEGKAFQNALMQREMEKANAELAKLISEEE